MFIYSTITLSFITLSIPYLASTPHLTSVGVILVDIDRIIIVISDWKQHYPLLLLSNYTPYYYQPQPSIISFKTVWHLIPIPLQCYPVSTCLCLARCRDWNIHLYRLPIAPLNSSYRIWPCSKIWHGVSQCTICYNYSYIVIIPILDANFWLSFWQGWRGNWPSNIISHS